MWFKASFLFVICFLILGNVLATVEEEGKEEKPKEEEAKKEEAGDNSRRKQTNIKSFTCDDQCLSWLHNDSRDDLADELIVPRSSGRDITVQQFFKIHIPKVEEQRKMLDDYNWEQCAAIWIIKGRLRDFKYIPAHPNDGSGRTPWVDNVYTAAPPRGVDENYLLARPEWWPSNIAKNREKLHAEWILHNQVNKYHDLKAYVGAQKPITSVLMYSVKHPCGNCAKLLVKILKQITTANGNTRPPCSLGFREWYNGRTEDNRVNSETLHPGHITRLNKFPGV